MSKQSSTSYAVDNNRSYMEQAHSSDDPVQHLEQQLESMTIMPLGGGQEVGRSCILLKYRSLHRHSCVLFKCFKGRTVLLDCGNHPGRKGMDAHPFFDFVEASEVDLILITHFHIDHCAALPYFTEKTKFKGRIFMTHATKAIMQVMISDFVRLDGGGGGDKSSSNVMFTDAEFRNCMEKVEVIDYHVTMEHKGIQFCCYVAGHVLGAAMFAINIDGVKVLYTGDYSMEEDRHLMPAEIPPDRPDVLIVESTYGVINHDSRQLRESRFTSTVEAIVRRKGNCLIPVFATGRAQELLLILDEYWKANPDLQEVPIYYASKMASKALRVYQTFVNMMNSHIQTLMEVRNPFHFNYISNLKGTDTSMQLMAPCVVMASPGMLQSGESRKLFEDWCDDERNGVILPGYVVQGTLANDLLSNPQVISCLNGRIKKCLCSVEYVSFSAHVDYTQNAQFIRSVVPDRAIVLVHGERNEMERLKTKLEGDFYESWPDKTHRPVIVMPSNATPVKISFDKPIIANIVGSIASNILQEMNYQNEIKNGEDNSVGIIKIPDDTVLITENFQSKIMSAKDISIYTSCRIGQIEQQMIVPLPAEILQLRQHNGINVMRMLLPHLREVFDNIEEIKTSSSNESDDNITQICIEHSVTIEENISNKSESVLVLWLASPTNDLIADCAAGLLFQVLSATHFLRACWLEASSNKVKEKTKSLDGNEEEVKEGTKRTNSSEEIIVKRMKMGLLDPSRAFVHENKIDGLIFEDMDSKLVAKSKPKLLAIQNYLTAYKNCLFKSISLSCNGLRLIIRSHDYSSGLVSGDNKPLLEAYCYIHWGDKQVGSDNATCSKRHNHSKKCFGHSHKSIPTACHAVVQSSSQWLREEISLALKKMEDAI